MKKSLMENFIFCAVTLTRKTLDIWTLDIRHLDI